VWKRKTEARGRPQLDSGDDTDHGSVVSATGKIKMKVVAELFTEEEEQQMVEPLVLEAQQIAEVTDSVCSYPLQ